MMDFSINERELAEMYGLPHIQQLVYLRGIRPYMDVKTGMVGIKRKISHQSIAEQLYIEPHPGIKSESFSRGQVRRALASLDRVGLITIQSEGLQLILKCNLATLGYSVQNKAGINPTYQADIVAAADSPVNKRTVEDFSKQADIAESPKADTPLKDNNYIYLLSQFEQFWALYPEKKAKHKTWEFFQALNPDPTLFQQMIGALTNEIKAMDAKTAQGLWTPPWKYPANWLAQRAWEDEITITTVKENKHEKRQRNIEHQPSKDPFCPPRKKRTEPSNIVSLNRNRA